VYGGTSFYQRKEIKDVIAYLRLTVNPHDEEALRRIINYPARGIGQTTMDRVANAARIHEMPMWDVLRAPHLMADVSAATKNKLNAFVEMMKGFNARHTEEDAHGLTLDIVRISGMQAEVNRGMEPEDIARKENLQELMDGIAAFVEERNEQGQEALLTNYLQEVSLLSDVDENDSQSEDRLTLMTVHSAKGLEFKVVFVVGMEEDLFPSKMSMDSPKGLEEERRLFYVAITRAEEYLVITNARSRFRYGKTEFCEPSRFLRELDPRFLHIKGAASNSVPTGKYAGRIDVPSFESNSQKKPGSTVIPTGIDARRFVKVTPGLQQKEAPNISDIGLSSPSVYVGTRIMHERFGCGIVTAIDGKGVDTKATVNFDNVGTKQLLLRFAKFKVIE
jgi:DNA helicase-2/ATP-dependent DNA helicase PcrA